MNFSVKSLSIVIGCIAGILSIFTIRVPVVCILIAIGAIFVTEGVLRLQDKS